MQSRILLKLRHLRNVLYQAIIHILSVIQAEDNKRNKRVVHSNEGE